MAFEFVKPIYLYLLVLIPLAILIHFLTLKRKRSQALQFANFDAIARVKGTDLLSKNISVLLLTIVITSLLVLSLAGIRVQRTLLASSFSSVIAIDTSRSMEATDFFPTRLEAAKRAALSFVDLSPPATKIGVISFSGNAFIEQSITEDKLVLKQAIQEIPLSTVGGTDINEAIITATNLLRDQEAKTVIVLSDGRINVGTLEDAIDYANDHGVIVHTIGIGTVTGGQTTYGLSRLDEDILRAAAHNTGGSYFNTENKELLEQSLGEIMGLKLRKVSIDISSYLLIAALVLFVVEYILVNTRYRVLP